MSKFAFIFPGQGSQKIGMGSELSENFRSARETFKEADSILGRNLSQICWSGSAEELTKTENAQLAILTSSVATLRVLQGEQALNAKVVAGHSLGEYSGLFAAGVFDFPTALKLVKFRSEFMAGAAQKNRGSMTAILGLTAELAKQLCDDARKFGIVSVANFNTPTQQIVSGEIPAIEKVAELAKSAGAKRVIPLAVSGAFHSELMENARDKFRSVIDDFEFSEPSIDFVANVTGDFVKSADEIKSLLVKQIASPVLWTKSIETIRNSEISNFVEVGESRVLTGMLRQIDRNLKCFEVGKVIKNGLQ